MVVVVVVVEVVVVVVVVIVVVVVVVVVKVVVVVVVVVVFVPLHPDTIPPLIASGTLATTLSRTTQSLGSKLPAHLQPTQST